MASPTWSRLYRQQSVTWSPIVSATFSDNLLTLSSVNQIKSEVPSKDDLERLQHFVEETQESHRGKEGQNYQLQLTSIEKQRREWEEAREKAEAMSQIFDSLIITSKYKYTPPSSLHVMRIVKLLVNCSICRRQTLRELWTGHCTDRSRLSGVLSVWAHQQSQLRHGHQPVHPDRARGLLAADGRNVGGR